MVRKTQMRSNKRKAEKRRKAIKRRKVIKKRKQTKRKQMGGSGIIDWFNDWWYQNPQEPEPAQEPATAQEPDFPKGLRTKRRIIKDKLPEKRRRKNTDIPYSESI